MSRLVAKTREPWLNQDQNQTHHHSITDKEVIMDYQPAETAISPSHSRSSQWWRWIALLVLLGGLLVLSKSLGLDKYLHAKKIQHLVEQAGIFGVLVFWGLFIMGQLLQIPGLLFVAVGVYAYGRWLGGGLVLIGAILAVSVSFWLVRRVGGMALSEMRWSLLKNMLARLEQQPVMVVSILRLVFWFSPPVNYALALSSVPFRYFLIGSCLGLTPVVLVAVIFFDWLFR